MTNCRQNISRPVDEPNSSFSLVNTSFLATLEVITRGAIGPVACLTVRSVRRSDSEGPVNDNGQNVFRYLFWAFGVHTDKR